MSHRVLIVDDHAVVRLGLRALFVHSNVEIVGETGTSEEAVRLARELKPDVVLMDVRMDHDDGLIALKTIRTELPDTAVLMLSNYDNPTYIARAMAQGACGYLLKDVSRDNLLAAIRKAAEGANVWTPTEIRRYTGSLRAAQGQPAAEYSLTHRESEVLHQMAYGLTNKEIADALKISYETVKEHVQHILKKLAVSDRTQAAVWAVRKGLV